MHPSRQCTDQLVHLLFVVAFIYIDIYLCLKKLVENGLIDVSCSGVSGRVEEEAKVLTDSKIT